MTAMVYVAAMATYHWFRLRAPDRTWTESYENLLQGDLRGVDIWGAFYGLFGIGSNELVLVLHTDGASPFGAVTEAGFEVVESHTFVPTVRPERFVPLTEDGLYVFRFFDVVDRDVDEIARLSNQAWTSFENSDAYATKPLALFRQAEPSDASGVMLLLTWYDGFDSWQTSRRSAPDARENFQKRRALTQGTIAYATRLVGT